MSSKFYKIMLFILTPIIVVLGFLYIKDLQEEQRKWENFLNRFDQTLDNSLRRLNHLIEDQPEGDALERGIHNLEKDLLETHYVIDSGDSFLRKGIHGTTYFREATYYLYGLSMSGTIDAEIPPLGKDEKLDERELALLTTIRDDIAQAKEEIYSSETNQEDPEVSLRVFNDKILEYVDDNFTDIYRRTF